MTSKETMFPRGGKISALSKPNKATSFTLFTKRNTRLKKKHKKKKENNIQNLHKDKKKKKGDSRKELVVKYVDDLTPAILQEGMLVLGIVSHITEKVVKLSLPGGIKGIVNVVNISQFYKDLVLKSTEKTGAVGLQELFKIGEILPAKVLSADDDKYTFHLTLDPKQINSKIGDIETGLILVGYVKSEEDHGYIIDFGIPSVNSFLNFDKIPNQGKLIIGKFVRCIILKYIKSQGSCSVELSLLENDLKHGKLSSDSSYPIHSFIPGLQFTVTVERVLKNGVEVSFREDKSVKGYIYEDQLPHLFPKISNTSVGKKYVGTLLYVKPLVNIPYFKVISYKPQNWIYRFGQIVKGKVIKSARCGITFRIGKKLIPMKCFVPFAKLANAHKLIENETEVEALYPVGKSVGKIRLGTIDYMRRCYLGSTDKASLEEKYYSVFDLKCGDIVPCRVSCIEQSFIRVKIGQTISGLIDNMDLTDIPAKNPGSRLKIDQNVRARVLEVDTKTRFVRLTMKPTLMKKNFEILADYDSAKKKNSYIGTVFMVFPHKLVVKFFNGVMGHVPKNCTPYKDSQSLKEHFVCGQLVKCYVVNCIESNLRLTLMSQEDLNCKFNIGEKYEVVIIEKSELGLLVNIEINENGDTAKGLIPNELVSDYPGLGKYLVATYAVKDKIMAYHVLHRKGNLPIFAISGVVCRFYEILNEEKTGQKLLLKSGQIYPFLFGFVDSKIKRLILYSLIPGQERMRFSADMSGLGSDISNLRDVPIKMYQIVYGVIGTLLDNQVDVSIHLSDVWDKNYRTSLDLLDTYLDGVKRLIKFHKKTRENYTRDVTLGSEVSAFVNSTQQDSDIYEVDTADTPPREENMKNQIKGKIVWIRAEEKLLSINVNPRCISDVNKNQDKEVDLSNATYSSRIVYIGEEVIVAALKGKGDGILVFLPRKRHMNDFQNSESPYTIGCTIKTWVERGKFNNFVAIDRKVRLLQEKIIWKSYEQNLRQSILSRKRKLPIESSESKLRKVNDNGETEMEIIDIKLAEKTNVKQENDDENDIQCEYSGIAEGVFNGTLLNNEIKQEVEDSEMGAYGMEESTLPNVMDLEIKSENESDDDHVLEKDETDIYSKERLLLSSSSDDESDSDIKVKEENGRTCNLNVGFNWDVLNNRKLLSGANLKPEESSTDDDEESRNTKRKRVRLTKSEKEEKAKQEEERLRQIEERLMNTDHEPETADDFDRAVLAKPNSSALWVKYMAFHLQATEIEKARAVARRALKAIAFNEEQEKLNVWIGLLNLENLYGNEETLGKTLSEALACNEPYHVHLHVLNMHGQSNKFQEMERIGNMMLKKYKDIENLWYDVGLAYYRVGKVECARHVLQRALTVLSKKRHVELISKFAQMENKYGSSERAQTLYETILASFPKRVDVWSCYVDMLVKSNLLDLARQVLERATSQHLPPRKMKILFKKFIDFEEKHGIPENVEKVRESAVEYVNRISSMGKD